MTINTREMFTDKYSWPYRYGTC